MNLGFVLMVFGMFCFLVAIMSIGVLVGRRPISGSCGGIGRLKGEGNECAICGDDPIKCEEATDQKSVVGNSISFRNASRSRNFS